MARRHQLYEKDLLGGKGVRFLADLLLTVPGLRLSPGVTFIALPEYGYRASAIPPGNQTDQMRLDLLFVILSRRKNISVGVEIKVEKNDLLFGEKLHYELGVTDYFFLAVPRRLVPAAIYVLKRQQPADIPKIGLIDLDNGEIIILPQKNEKTGGVLPILSNALRKGYVRMEIPADLEDNPVFFYPYKGFRVNVKYGGMFTKPFRPTLPTAGERYERFKYSALYQQLLLTPASKAG